MYLHLFKWNSMKCANETECCPVSRTSASAGKAAKRDTKHGEKQQHQNEDETRVIGWSQRGEKASWGCLRCVSQRTKDAATVYKKAELPLSRLFHTSYRPLSNYNLSFTQISSCTTYPRQNSHAEDPPYSFCPLRFECMGSCTSSSPTLILPYSPK